MLTGRRPRPTRHRLLPVALVAAALAAVLAAPTAASAEGGGRGHAVGRDDVARRPAVVPIASPIAPPVPLSVASPASVARTWSARPADPDRPAPVLVYVPGGAGLGFPTEDLFQQWARPYVDAGYVVVMPRTDVGVLPVAVDRDGDGQVDDPSSLTALSGLGVAYDPSQALLDVMGDMVLRSGTTPPAYVCNPYRDDGVEPVTYPLPSGDVPCWLFLDQYRRTLAQVRATVSWLEGPGAAQLGVDPGAVTVLGESSGATTALDLALEPAGLPRPPALVVTVAGSYPLLADLPAARPGSPVVLFEYAAPDQPTLYRPANGLPFPDSSMVFDRLAATRGTGALLRLDGSGHIPPAGTPEAACVQEVTIAVGAPGGVHRATTDRSIGVSCRPGVVTGVARTDGAP